MLGQDAQGLAAITATTDVDLGLQHGGAGLEPTLCWGRDLMTFDARFIVFLTVIMSGLCTLIGASCCQVLAPRDQASTEELARPWLRPPSTTTYPLEATAA